jgi:hypothetical protein
MAAKSKCLYVGVIRINKTLLLGVICIGLLLTSTVTQAAPVHDEFFVWLDPPNIISQGSGSGFAQGTWFEYTDPTAGPNWWNQWFFNSPDIAGSKEIEWNISIEGDIPIGLIELAINYSTQDWLDPAQPPLPDLNQFIVRESIFIGPPSGVISNIGDPLLIPDFNPIWVSMDIRILDPLIFPVLVTGEIWHEHIPIPEPAATTLCLIGLAAMAIRRRCAWLP